VYGRQFEHWSGRITIALVFIALVIPYHFALQQKHWERPKYVIFDVLMLLLAIAFTVANYIIVSSTSYPQVCESYLDMVMSCLM